MWDWWFGFDEEEEVKEYKRTISEAEEEELWKDLEEAGLLPTEVKTLPECASFKEFDHHGNEIWQGVSGREYEIIKS